MTTTPQAPIAQLDWSLHVSEWSAAAGICWEVAASGETISHMKVQRDDLLQLIRAALATNAPTQPAAGADVLDAWRYRMVRRGQHWSVINGIGDTLRGEDLDTAIDAQL